MGILIFKLRRNIGQYQMKFACTKDKSRPAMTGAIIAPEHNEICCTDAHILVRYPIEVIEVTKSDAISVPLFIFNKNHYFNYSKDKNFNMTDFVFKLDYKNRFISVHEPNVENECTEENMILKIKTIEGNPPNYMAVYPDYKENDGVNYIGVNLDLLEQLKKATKEPYASKLHSPQHFKLILSQPNRGVIVEEQNKPYPIKAMFMPVMLSY